VSIAYFTGNPFPFTKKINGIKKGFWPITKPFLKNRHRWRGQYSWFHYLSNTVNPPDLTIINMSGHGSKYCFKLGELLRKKGKPYIAMIGGIHVSTEGPAKKYFQNAHNIIVHTNLQKTQLLHLKTFKNLNIQVMPLGVDTTEFFPLTKVSKEVELLFVGRITRLKQIELCFETLAFLMKNLNRKVKLIIIGPVSDRAYLSELESLAAQLEITDQVEFVGPLKQCDLVPYYQKATLFLLPSAHESFGMVMVEAMACGTPVAALKESGGADEIVVDGVNGLLTNKDTFSERILEYLKSDEMKKIFSENARIMVEKKW